MAQFKGTASAPWHALSPVETATRLESHLTNGLTRPDAEDRLSALGPNALTEEKRESFWQEFFEELREPMVLMLLVTGVLYAIWGEAAEAIIIFVIILILNTIEVVNEQRAKKAIAGLRKLAEPTAAVYRDGVLQEVAVEAVVPGDLILLQQGRRVPADARLVRSSGLLVDESTLTGESVPVDKTAALLPGHDRPLAERGNMVYSGTLVSRGRGAALVVATGMETEIGRITGLTRQVREPRTSLQQIMSELSKSLVWFALGFSLLVPLVGIFIAHQPPQAMVLTGLSLAFATIPEELPIIITMVLALGGARLSKRGAIAKRLQAVESLGAITVIATDKTGTLTENRLVVTHFEPAANTDQLLEIGALCNDAILTDGQILGDPMDAALLRAANDHELDPAVLQEHWPIQQAFPFESGQRRQAVIVGGEDSRRALVKGAPEALLPHCTSMRSEGAQTPLDADTRRTLLARVDELAAEGLRVLALAARAVPEGEAVDADSVAAGLTFIGLVGLADPPRPEAREAIASCRRAGVRTVMITGDHPSTARAVARQVGLSHPEEVVTGSELAGLTDDELRDMVGGHTVFARTTPEQKLRLVRALQANGERVAVTGDGVNDAPALAAADIGVAMARGGTDVAREASDMLLTDDNFTTIVEAVAEGRLIFENLTKGVRYYLACKLALVLITLLPTLLLVPVPFTPVQIILMELFMDLMAAAAFVAEPPETDLLRQPPRDPGSRFMNGRMVGSILTAALGLFVAVSVLYLSVWYGTQNVAHAQTVAFFAWLVGHVFLAFNLRSERGSLFRRNQGRNRMMWIWALAVAAFLGLVNLVPWLRGLLGVMALDGVQWVWIIAMCALGTFWMEARKAIVARRHAEG